MKKLILLFFVLMFGTIYGFWGGVGSPNLKEKNLHNQLGKGSVRLADFDISIVDKNPTKKLIPIGRKINPQKEEYEKVYDVTIAFKDPVSKEFVSLRDIENSMPIFINIQSFDISDSHISHLFKMEVNGTVITDFNDGFLEMVNLTEDVEGNTQHLYFQIKLKVEDDGNLDTINFLNQFKPIFSVSAYTGR